MFFLFSSAGGCRLSGSAVTVARPAFWPFIKVENKRASDPGDARLSWNLCRFYNESKFENFISVLLCRWVSWTPPPIWAVLQLSPCISSIEDTAFSRFSCSCRHIMKFGTLCELDAACVIVDFSLEITRAGFVNFLFLGDVHFGCLLLRWLKFAKL